MAVEARIRTRVQARVEPPAAAVPQARADRNWAPGARAAGAFQAGYNRRKSDGMLAEPEGGATAGGTGPAACSEGG